MRWISDRRGDAAPDGVWKAAAAHFGEAGMAAPIRWATAADFCGRPNTPAKEPLDAI